MKGKKPFKKKAKSNQDFNKPLEKKEEAKTPESSDSNEGGTRLNKYLAHCGIASRRKCAELIKEGHVKINGQIILEIGHKVMKGDEVLFKGKKATIEERKVYLLLNKPKDTVTTSSDEHGRKTVLDIVRDAVKERIFPVGRLDRATTGLLLLTNDGDLAMKLSHPRYEIKKVYHVVLDKNVSDDHIKMIANGLDLDDGNAPVDSVSHVKGASKNEVGIEIHIGRNRIVRRIFEHLGYTVKRLDRVYYAGLTKKDIPRGRFRFLSEKEIIMLKHFI